MSFLIAVPELLGVAARDLENVAATLNSANLAAALPTTGLAAAGGDEISTAIVAVFGSHALQYQGLSAQANSFHQQFVRALSSAAGQYAVAEALNTSPLQSALDLINAPTQTLLNRPLIGNGANGSSPGQPGGAGGLLYGNGGNGAPGTNAGVAGGAGGAAGLDRQWRQRRRR
ncbi:PE family protein, partial [Mycobacterium szulgai]